MENDKRFNSNELVELSKQISNSKVISNLQTFNDEMTISQVVRFFERHGKQLTKTMIQNYVRIGILPPPIDKRYYTKNHLILLTLIDQLKDIYSLEDIKLVFSPILKDLSTFDDDVIDISKIYEDYITLQNKALQKWQIDLPNVLDNVNQQILKTDINEKDKNSVSIFLIILMLMAQSIATKQLVTLIANKYIKS